MSDLSELKRILADETTSCEVLQAEWDKASLRNQYGIGLLIAGNPNCPMKLVKEFISKDSYVEQLLINPAWDLFVLECPELEQMLLIAEAKKLRIRLWEAENKAKGSYKYELQALELKTQLNRIKAKLPENTVF